MVDAWSAFRHAAADITAPFLVVRAVLAVALVDYRSPMWVPGVESGRLRTDTNGVVIAEKAARDLHVHVGDAIVVNHPLRQGTGYKLVDSTMRVDAIHTIPYRFIAFMDIRAARIMNLDGIYNTVAIGPKHGTSLTSLQRTRCSAFRVSAPRSRCSRSPRASGRW